MAAVWLALSGSAALGPFGVFAVLPRSATLVRLAGLAVSAALAGLVLVRTAGTGVLALVLAVAIAVGAGTLARTDETWL